MREEEEEEEGSHLYGAQYCELDLKSALCKFGNILVEYECANDVLFTVLPITVKLYLS